MKTFVLVGMLLAISCATNAHAGSAGTGGHGADVVFCTRWDTWITRHPKAAGTRGNELAGYYSWDWLQLNRPPLLMVPGKDAEYYVDQIQDFLGRNFPSLAGRFAAFRGRAFISAITADEQGIIRTWVNQIKDGEPPEGNTPLPPNCEKKPTRVITRTPIGTERNNVILYYYSPEIIARLKKQNNPQYSMVLLHEFFRDDRDNRDPAIWLANVTIHGTQREAERTQDLKTLLLALGIETGDTRADIAAAVARQRVYLAFIEEQKAVNQEISALNKTWKDIAMEHGQKKSCELDELMKRAWSAFVARVQGQGPAPKDPILRALSSEIGFESVLGSWPTLHEACIAAGMGPLPGGIIMGNLGPLPSLGTMSPETDLAACARKAEEIHAEIAAISIKDWDSDVVRQASVNYFGYRMDCAPKGVMQGYIVSSLGVLAIQTAWGLPPMPPLGAPAFPLPGTMKQ